MSFDVWRAGVARTDITAFEPGRTTVAGWGRPQLRLRGVAEPIHARALVLDDGELLLALVCVELCFVSSAVREAVLDSLRREHPERGFEAKGLLLSATHSHGGPDGLAPELAYASSNAGFSAFVFDAVVAGIVEAIIEADERREPARLRFAEVEIPAHEPVAFNRSLAAFARNHDAPNIPDDCPELATHRRSACLRVEDLQGRALGLVNWLGVHGTNVHPGVELVHGDNKGIAATLVERSMRSPGSEFVALFMQEAAGDVSPNHRWDRRRSLRVAGFEDDFDSARRNGEIQARYALEGLRAAATTEPIPARAWARVRHLDMRRVEIDPRYVAAQTGVNGRAHTSPPVIGLSFVGGTDEGPGPLHPLLPALRRVVGVRRAWARLTDIPVDPKLPFLHASGGVEAGRFLAKLPVRVGLSLVGPHEPGAAFVREVDAAGLADESLVPEIVPLQLLGLGPLTIVALPFEPTTMAGHRIRASVRAASATDSAGPVVLTTYANAYASYLTTFEEYGEQAYEGGATLFGPWSLDACRTALVAMLGERELDAFVPDPPRFDRRRAERQRAAGERSTGSSTPPRVRRAGPAAIPPLARGRDGLYHPTSEAEVVELVAFARTSGRPLRVVGARHSVAAAIHATPGDVEPVELCLDRLDKVQFDDASMQVRVGAGCRFGLDPNDASGRAQLERGLCAQLEARGWALASLGGVSHQTVAGFLATGSAGGSLRWSLAEQVVGIRLVDGTGAVHELERQRDRGRFEAALTSLGLLGVVTELRLQCEPSYRVHGQEQVFARADAPFDLLADGDAGLMAMFARHDYARVLWWPQPNVDRLVVWVGDRQRGDLEAVDEPYEAFPRVLGSRIPAQAAAGLALRAVAKLGGVRARPAAPGLARTLDERALAGLYRVFVPIAEPRTFAGPWLEVLTLDDQIAERWTPVEFCEIWIAEAHAAEALARLAALFERDGYAATQNFVCELYPGKACDAWLHPGYGRTSLRINLFWLADEAERHDPDQLWFPRIHALLGDLEPRMHWGKHLPRDPALIAAVARSYPQRDEFLALRRRCDPDELFSTDYWRLHLGLDPRIQPRSPSRIARPAPRLFHLDDPANAGSVGAAVEVELEHTVPGACEQVAAVVCDRASWSSWVPRVREVSPITEHTSEVELERVRVRVELDLEAPERIVARLVGLSLPVIAAATIELELRPLGPSSAGLRVRAELTPIAPLDRPWLARSLRRSLRAELERTIAALCVELDRRTLLATRAGLADSCWPTPPRTPLIAVPPMFHMQPAGAELLHAARSHLRVWARVPASALTVDHNITRFDAADRWLASFLGVRWLGETREGPGAQFEEFFSFMSLRVRTLEHEPGRRWFALCEACSLPLAVRMVQEIRFEPLGPSMTLLYWHVAFDAPALLRPAVGVVGPMVRAWMQRSVDQLAALHGADAVGISK